MASLAPDSFSYCAARSARANCRSEAAAMRRDWACALPVPRKKRRPSTIAAMARSNAAPLRCRIGWRLSMGTRTARSDAESHHFGGFDERGGALAGLQAHLFGGIGGDDGGDVLLADCERNLRQESAEFDGDDAPDELVAPADLAEIAAACGDVAALKLLRNQPVDFRFRHAMVPAGRLGALDLAVVDPLLQRRIADAKDAGGFARC